jgi:hypothetical protein
MNTVNQTLLFHFFLNVNGRILSSLITLLNAKGVSNSDIVDKSYYLSSSTSSVVRISLLRMTYVAFLIKGTVQDSFQVRRQVIHMAEAFTVTKKST